MQLFFINRGIDAFKVFRIQHDFIICHDVIHDSFLHNFMYSRIPSWHVKGVAAKDFSVIHTPIKCIFWNNQVWDLVIDV